MQRNLKSFPTSESLLRPHLSLASSRLHSNCKDKFAKMSDDRNRDMDRLMNVNEFLKEEMEADVRAEATARAEEARLNVRLTIYEFIMENSTHPPIRRRESAPAMSPPVRTESVGEASGGAAGATGGGEASGGTPPPAPLMKQRSAPQMSLLKRPTLPDLTELEGEAAAAAALEKEQETAAAEEKDQETAEKDQETAAAEGKDQVPVAAMAKNQETAAAEEKGQETAEKEQGPAAAEEEDQVPAAAEEEDKETAAAEEKPLNIQDELSGLMKDMEELLPQISVPAGATPPPDSGEGGEKQDKTL